MGQDVAIEFRNVSKRYRIGAGQGSLRSALGDLFSRRARKHDEETNTLWALRDVSFELKRGETLGIIGHNGAGKTTVLKLLSRITRPTEGEIVLHGRVSSLIELGAGFHPELTGRENVFLNGQILGMSRREIAQRYDEIVAFSELGDFMDTPVKRYSSGMYARLGFSVAAHLDPDILLVDEVLSVGDVSFQQKSLARMHALADRGTTVVFVSHNIGAVQDMCSKTIWLNRGQIARYGATPEVLEAYLYHANLRRGQAEAEQNQIALESTPVEIRRVSFLNSKGTETTTFYPGDDLVVQLHYYAEQVIEQPNFSVGINLGGRTSLFLATTMIDGDAPDELPVGNGVISCHFRSVPLMPGRYEVWAEVRGAHRVGYLVPWHCVGAINIMMDTNGLVRIGGKDPSLFHLLANAPVYVPYEWEIKRDIND